MNMDKKIYKEEIFNLAKRHKDYNSIMHEKINQEEISIIKSCATKEARELYLMEKEIINELHRYKGFLRLNISPNGILYGSIDTKNNIIDLLLLHFHKRFPNAYILLEWKDNCYGIDSFGEYEFFIMGINESLKILEEKYPINELFLELSQEGLYWDEYFNSQNISLRRNTTLLKQKMPKKYRGNLENNCIHKSNKIDSYF
jgi:probable DNA metabolism protein